MQHTPTLKQRCSMGACLASYPTAGTAMLYGRAKVFGCTSFGLCCCSATFLFLHTHTNTHFPLCSWKAVVDWFGRKTKSTIGFANQFDSNYLMAQAHQRFVFFVLNHSLKVHLVAFLQLVPLCSHCPITSEPELVNRSHK